MDCVLMNQAYVDACTELKDFNACHIPRIYKNNML
jgi:hypothetical protein